MSILLSAIIMVTEITVWLQLGDHDNGEKKLILNVETENEQWCPVSK